MRNAFTSREGFNHGTARRSGRGGYNKNFHRDNWQALHNDFRQCDQ